MQAPESPFLNSLYRYMSVRSYSKRTIETYPYWIKLFVMYHGKRHPSAMGSSEVDRTVSQSTQCVALNALAFLYNKFLNQPLGDISAFQRSRKQPKLPVVLTRQEVKSLLSHLSGTQWLIASVLYGSGLRRVEVVRLRIKDIDFDHLQLQIWNGKGFKHRLTTLAPELIKPLKHQVERDPIY